MPRTDTCAGGFLFVSTCVWSKPRLLHDLLSDDPQDRVGLEDLRDAPLDADSVATEFAREIEVRRKARELLFEMDAKRKLHHAAAAAKHRDQVFQCGTWVYVWRRSPSKKGVKTGGLLRDRWVGPGVVALHSGGTVWVGMRSRLWKCSAEQVRMATHPESLGAELIMQGALGNMIQQVARGSPNVGLDVVREGPPPPEAWDEPVFRDPSGAVPAEGVATDRIGPDGETSNPNLNAPPERKVTIISTQ